MNEIEYEITGIRDYYFFPHDNYLMKALNNYADGQGFGEEASACYFSTETVKGEEDYLEDGVCYFFYQATTQPKDIIISYDKFYGYLLYAVEKYLKKYPENKDEVENLLSKIRERFSISNDIQPISYDKLPNEN